MSTFAPRPWRSRLLIAIATLVAAGILAIVVAVVVLWSGLYDVAASVGHPRPVAELLHFAMRRSVALHAPDGPVPNLDDPALILRGATHYGTGCAPCHGAPGQLASPIAKGMTPVPPGLYDVDRGFAPNELFWIVKNGVKMTAMPAWPAPQRDDEVWDMVAFLEHLPDYNTAAYAALSGAGNTGFLSGPLPAAADQAGSFSPADCARCHGADGNGRQGAYPHLAGLSRTYIEQTLRDFRDGSRPSGFMQPVAAALSDAEIEQAAAFYSQQPRQADKPGNLDPALLKEGQSLVEGSAGIDKGAACFSCHTPDPDKRSAAIPQLTGQPADYLVTQLRLFRAGVRSGTPPARAMAKVAHNLTDTQIAAVSAYLASLPATP